MLLKLEVLPPIRVPFDNWTKKKEWATAPRSKKHISDRWNGHIIHSNNNWVQTNDVDRICLRLKVANVFCKFVRETCSCEYNVYWREQHVMIGVDTSIYLNTLNQLILHYLCSRWKSQPGLSLCRYVISSFHYDTYNNAVAFDTFDISEVSAFKYWSTSIALHTKPKQECYSLYITDLCNSATFPTWSWLISITSHFLNLIRSSLQF